MAKTPDTDLRDLGDGIPASELENGESIVGRLGDARVLVARVGAEVFAVGAKCTHYSGPLGDGLIVGDTVRCPLHHACFSLRTGEALRAPAFDPIPRWRVEQRGDRIYVREKIDASSATRSTQPIQPPASVVIIGGGAAGFAAAEMLRREGYDGPVTLISADARAPYDRPNLSKDYLAGEAQPEWMPLQSDDFYRDQRIDLVLDRTVTAIDIADRHLVLSDGSRRPYGRLLLATGADPVRLTTTGAETANVCYLRSFNDSDAIVARVKAGARALVVGASFIGLEVAAALRAREVVVDVVAPESAPLERVLGREIGAFVRALHESHGVTFHLGETVTRFDGRTATLSGGSTLDADIVIAGIGVRPSVGLAEQSGLRVDRGVVVDQYLETSAPGIFAAGDIARWPDPHTGEAIRVEHWVVAERQGQVAARNMLGRPEAFDAVPFFWSQHYDRTIRYAGHADKWDAADVDGTLDANADASCTVTFRRGRKRLAVATIGRDRACLEAEAAIEGGKS